MITLFAVMLAATSTAPLKFTLPPESPPKRCTGKCSERYRVPASSDDLRSIKDRALADDGSKCNVVGAQRCLSSRRTFFRSTEDPMDTLRSNFGK